MMWEVTWIFRDFSSNSKTIFKDVPITANTIKMVKAKCCKDSSLKKIEEYAGIIEKKYDMLRS